jgi:hypothetical protein
MTDNDDILYRLWQGTTSKGESNDETGGGHD